MQTSYDVDDTIVAIASAAGPAQRGIVRMSGPLTSECLGKIFRPNDSTVLDSIHNTVQLSGTIGSPEGTPIPGQLLYWPTKRSYTRQPTAEFHTIGSMPLLQMVVEQVCNAGARLAQPGEFTLRAFLSGRIDLTQAEAVLAVIDAEGEQQFEAALRQLAGGLAGPLGELREELIGVLAELEAGLDFVEEDIEFISKEELKRQLHDVHIRLRKIIDQIATRNTSNEVCKVVLTGLPNAGKSTLFNMLADSNQAIVSQIAGTTTDYVTARINIESSVFELIDTAGKEESHDAISTEAQQFREQQSVEADVTLHCVDSTAGLAVWDRERLHSERRPDIVVLTKHHDSVQSPTCAEAIATGFSGPIIATNNADQFDCTELRQSILESSVSKVLNDQSVVGPTVIRVSESLNDALTSLEHAISANQHEMGDEIVAAEIRQSLNGLGQVVGTIYTDDILDLVFGRFCIGK